MFDTTNTQPTDPTGLSTDGFVEVAEVTDLVGAPRDSTTVLFDLAAILQDMCTCCVGSPPAFYGILKGFAGVSNGFV